MNARSWLALALVLSLPASSPVAAQGTEAAPPTARDPGAAPGWAATPPALRAAPAIADREEAQEGPVAAARPLEPMDVFELEWASDPRIAPDGSRIVYVRRGNDVMSDRTRSQIWTVATDGADHRPLVTGASDYGSPRWSPDGERLAYVATDEHDRRQLFVRWMDTGEEARVTQLPRSPSGLAWSPDGEWIAFSRFVEEERDPIASLPEKPEGAEWAEPARVTRDVVYRSDGGGYLDPGHRQLFVVSSRGGTPRQLTTGPYDHGGTPAWGPDSRTLYFSANRKADAELDPLDSEVWAVPVEGGEPRALTDRRGPDTDPAVSPDGSTVAYLGFDDREQGYQVTRLYLVGRDGSDPRVLTEGLDRDVSDPVWAADGSGLFFQYDDRGNTKVAFVDLRAGVRDLAANLGGTSIGRPYGGGSFTVARNGTFAYTHTGPDHPADVAVGSRRDAGGADAGGGADASGVAEAGGAAEAGGGEAPDGRRLTHLNRDLFAQVDLGEVEEITYTSSHDGREIQGWIVKPPGFDPSRRYPLLLEIHGGPFANYGDRFTAEIQLYAAEGYVVLYTNPRGSTSYGQEFGNLIHHAYPGHDYDDLMSGVDAVIERGYVDPDRLYVTGGSGGGVLSSWIVGKTDRFRAAVVQKPVINWMSWALTADMYPMGVKYWFPATPWEEPIHYWERSPLSLVGNVATPTMLVTGEADYRTPISESEQFYQALKLRGVAAALVRIPGASHGIADRPSHLLSKVLHVMGWFDLHGGPGAERTADR